MKIPDLLKNPVALALGGAAALGVVLFARRGSSGAAGPGPWGQSPIAGPGDRVLLIGDSLAAGLAKPMKSLADQAGIPFRGRGVVGSRIDEWDKKYLSEEDLAFAPTVAIVSLGTNDMKMFDPTTQQAGHVVSLLSKLRGAGARIAWIIPPTMPFGDKGVRDMIAGAGPDLAVHAELLDLARAPDKIHMTPSGYQAFAQAVWDCATKNLCPTA